MLLNIGQGWTDFIRISPLISSLLLVVTFTISQVIAHYSRKNELRRSWYFKAYFDSSLEKVNDFFKVSDELVKKSLKKLETIDDPEDKQNYVTKKLEKISDSQRKFFVEVLDPLKGAYPDIFRHLDFILQSFFDVHSVAFDKKDSPQEAYSAYTTEITAIKNDLMAFLSIPVLKNKQSKKLIKDIENSNPLTYRFNFGIWFVSFMSVIALVIIVVLIWPKQTADQQILVNKQRVLEFTQNIVSTKILSPSTAIFDTDFLNHVQKSDEETYSISSYVDSENQFGAKVRSYFSCSVKLNSYKKPYKCVNLTIKTALNN